MRLKIAFVGGGSFFAYKSAMDLLLSETLRERPVTMVFMDSRPVAAEGTALFARRALEHMCQPSDTPAEPGERGSPGIEIGRGDGALPRFEATTDLAEALDGADYVICALERDRRKTWIQDYQIPLRHGFRQSLGECGGPGGLFHYLRNLGLMLEIAHAMEEHCPDAPLLCFTNPENRLPLAINTSTRVQCYGFCHGARGGATRAAELLGRPLAALDWAAAGLNHFSWITRLRDLETGEDLYPALREADRRTLLESGPILDRIALRRFGLWPAPGGDHLAEYVSWAEPFGHQHAWMFVDQLRPDPPEVRQPLTSAADRADAWLTREGGWEQVSKRSGDLPIPLIEAVESGQRARLSSFITMNDGAINNLPADAAVEVPALVNDGCVSPEPQGDLPEAIAAMCRTQISIHKLGLEAFHKPSKQHLLQAVLIDPVVNNYEAAVAMVEEFLQVQKEYLPHFE